MLTVNELFAGIGSQRAALERLGIEHKVVGIAEIDRFATLSYAAIYHDLDKKIKDYDFPSGIEMVDYLKEKNIGFDFKKNKPFSWERMVNKKTGKANKTLKQHYLASALSNNYGDIGKIDKLDYADFWTYSFPCQDISVAGKQAGIKHGKTRSGLLYEVERLLEVAQEHDELPKYLMLENVKNLVGKKFKPQFIEWITRLDELGYNTYWQVLNAKDYGIPQNRERVFGISIRKDIDTGYVFPEPFELKTRLKDILEDEVDEKFYINNDRMNVLLKNLETSKLQKDSTNVNQIGNCVESKGSFKNPQRGRVYSENGCSPALNCVGGGGLEPKILQVGNINPSGKGMNGNVFSEDGLAPTLTTNKGEGSKVAIKQATKKGYIECNVPGIEDLSFPDSKTRRGRVQENGEIVPTLMAGQQDICYIESQYRIRKLTPKECWRLMGFTDEQFQKAQDAGVSNSQLYKQAGNSIVVDVLYYLFKNLFTDSPTEKTEPGSELSGQMKLKDFI